MKLRICLLKLACIAVLLVACTSVVPVPGFAVPAAIAEEDERNQLEIRVSAKPGEMVEPGDVMLSFTIENISDMDAQNVYLSSADGLLSEPVGQLAPGAQQSFNRQHSVTQEELDGGKISYIISHDDPFDPNGKVNYTAHAQIRRSDVLPQAELTRRFSTRRIAPGGTLVITYRIRNTGNIALTNLRVQDGLGDFTGGVDRLAPGESRTLISRAIVEEDCASTAVLDYYAEGDDDTPYSLSLIEAAVTLAHTGLEASLSAAPSAFARSSAEALLTLVNTGDCEIRDLRITDEIQGGVIADKLVLPAGERLELSRSYALREETPFLWKITGVSEAGEAVSALAEASALSPEAGESAPLNLSVSTATPRIRRSGRVTVDVRIANPGGVDAQDVSLQEAASGELYTFAVVPAGDAVERAFSFDVRDDIAYTFSIAYAGADGEPQQVTAAPVEIAIAPDGVLPEGAKDTLIEFTGNSIKLGGSSVYGALLFSGLGVLLVLIVLLLIASRRARIQRQIRIAAEKQRRREELGKTNRFTPVRAPKTKSKGRKD